jgi:hypothetical protein
MCTDFVSAGSLLCFSRYRCCPFRSPIRGDARKVVGEGPPPAIFAVFVVLGSVVTLAMLGYVLAGLQYSPAAYITALTIDFFTVVFGYLIALDVIMQQPMEVPERPAPH